MNYKLAICISICTFFVFVIIWGLLHNWKKRKFYESIVDELQKIKDEMDKYGVETLEDLEVAKAKERAAAETENTKENTHTDVDTPPTV